MRGAARAVAVLFVLVASVTVDAGVNGSSAGVEPEPPPNRGEWVRIQAAFHADSYLVVSGCNEAYGVVGTQTCEGLYENRAGDTPPFVARRGTFTASRSAASPEMEVVFHYPQAEIRGKVPGAASDRYQATRILGVAGCECVSPPPNEIIAAGEKGGPLSLNVQAALCCPNNVYSMDVRGWVISKAAAPAPDSDPPDIDVDAFGLDAVTIDTPQEPD